MDDPRNEPRGPADAAAYMLGGFLLALVLVAAAALLLMGPMMGFGGMMGGPQQSGVGMGTWALVGALLALALVVVGFTFVRSARNRAGAAPAVTQTPTIPPDVQAVQAPLAAPVAPPAPPGAPAGEIEAVALRLLERDERLLYLEIKDKGGVALQKDIGQRDGFSRSKVTRTLDRLEAKGLIARERDGMTNRVRLLTRPGGAP